MRQTAHLHAFTNLDPNYRSERSGMKYREFMSNYGIRNLEIDIDYVDMSHFNIALIPMFEQMSIEHFMPEINQ